MNLRQFHYLTRLKIFFLVSFFLATSLRCVSTNSMTAASAEKMTADEVNAKCTFESDSYTKSDGIVTPTFTFQISTFPSDYSTGNYRLVMRRVKEGIEYRIGIACTRDGDWYFLSKAHDDSGNEHPLIIQDQRVNGAGWIVETGYVVVDRPYLQSHATGGLDFRIDGQRGSFYVKVPPAVVTGFLMATDSFSRGFGSSPNAAKN